MKHSFLSKFAPSLFAIAFLANFQASVFAQDTAKALKSKHVHSKVHRSDSRDEVVFKFATYGDSRTAIKEEGITAQDKRWLNATPVVSRMIREISARHANALFFNGDMVLGYTKDATQLEREYAYWRGMMGTLMESGTYVVPVPGNHESQMPTKGEDGKVVKLAQPHLEQAWRENMGDLIIDQKRWSQINPNAPITAFDPNNAPQVGEDGILTPQSQMSYSFDVGRAHFVIINTDAVGVDSSTPVTWIKRDFEAAKQRGANAFMVFGHKMPFTYIPEGLTKSDEEGLNTNEKNRDEFWSIIEQYRATYFCGHEHVYHASQPTAKDGGQAWQVIVGSGGSPFGIKPGESKNPQDRMYAWAEVEVFKSGSLNIKIRGFDEKKGPTQILAHWRVKPAKV